MESGRLPRKCPENGFEFEYWSDFRLKYALKALRTTPKARLNAQNSERNL